MMENLYKEIKSSIKTGLLLIGGCGIDNGLFHRNYQPYVIVSQGRSGSTTLSLCLDQNPHIVAWDEAFNKHYRSDAWRKKIWLNKPVTYINRFIYKIYPRYVQSVGFCLHYYQQQKIQSQNVWQYLAINNVKIIHLKRNPFHRYVDSRIAFKTDAWIAYNDFEAKESRRTDISIDIQHCLNYLQWVEKRSTEIDVLFSGYKKFELCYEDLVENLNEKVIIICEWLGVKPHPFVPRTVPLITRPMKEVIVNYEELKYELSNTKWISYID